MKVGLYDVDSKIPNLALMKLARFHKNQGDQVELYLPIELDTYDKIYASTIFDYSDKSGILPDRMEVGGTGWPGSKNLPAEVDRLEPDYSLWNFPHSIGFTMRGCRLRCPFCVVPAKEGRPYSENTIEEIWIQRESSFVMLLDNDFFGNPEWGARIDELLRLELRVNFNQGLNIRNLKADQAAALYSVDFRDMSNNKRRVTFAWDDPRHEKLIHKGLATVFDAGIIPGHIQVFVLIGYWSTPAQDLHRIEVLRDYGVSPFVMPYDKADRYQADFARWVNRKAVFASVAWEDYEGPRHRIPLKNLNQVDLFDV
jgi:hypothetical protein